MAGLGYSPDCRTCNSRHRGEIDSRLLGGESTRSVERWLMETYGERIRFDAIARHKKAHCNALEEAKVRVGAREVDRRALMTAASRAAFTVAVEKIVADVEVLNEVAGLGLHVARRLQRKMANPKRKKTMAEVVLFTGALKEARGAVTDRHELLHGKKVNVEGAGAGLVGLLSVDFDEPPPPIAGDAPPPGDPLADEAGPASAPASGSASAPDSASAPGATTVAGSDSAPDSASSSSDP